MNISGFLYSQIGYDLKDPMKAIIRSNSEDYIKDGTVFALLDAKSGKSSLSGKVEKWGPKWKSFWWLIDFSGLDREGEYKIAVSYDGKTVLKSGPFPVGPHILWDKTVKLVALEQLEERSKLARNQIGWKDCGSHWREVNSHATTVIGLCDLLELGYEWIEPEDRERLIKQIMVGCDYIGICQDKAEELGHPKGAIVHEIPSFIQIIPGDIAQSTVAFAMVSRLLSDIFPEKSRQYLARAQAAFGYITEHAKPYDSELFSHLNHGAPEDFAVPDEWMTRDLMMMLWGAVELWFCGKDVGYYLKKAEELAQKVLKRQVSKEKSEDGLYGHFYTFDSCDFTEKANTHHHFGYDTGGTFPHYIMPLLKMVCFWGKNPNIEKWRKAINDFAYGYFLPACSANPFYLIPEGYFKGEGLLNFCGPWHGINTTIAFASSLACVLEGFIGDRKFREIAVGGLQWIAGLNAGITTKSFGGCKVWREDVDEGKAVPYSQIYGVGTRYTGNWTDIRGTIPNGFDVNPQFELVVAPTLENDEPLLYTDEDWIPHSAGYISALAHLRRQKVLGDS